MAIQPVVRSAAWRLEVAYSNPRCDELFSGVITGIVDYVPETLLSYFWYVLH